MSVRKFLPEVVLVFLAAAARIVPHPPNVTPVAAMALLAGFAFGARPLAFVLPLAALFVSDLVLGLHESMIFVYGAFAVTVWIGTRLGEFRWTRTLGAALASSVLFFLLTNFGVWALGTLYPRTLAGLVACYGAAIPFFRNSVLGDLGFTVVLFNAYRLWSRRDSSMTIRSAGVLNRP